MLHVSRLVKFSCLFSWFPFEFCVSVSQMQAPPTCIWAVSWQLPVLRTMTPTLSITHWRAISSTLQSEGVTQEVVPASLYQTNASTWVRPTHTLNQTLCHFLYATKYICAPVHSHLPRNISVNTLIFMFISLFLHFIWLLGVCCTFHWFWFWNSQRFDLAKN